MLTSSFRRTWFLERVLKLGLVQIAKEYQCVSHQTSTSHLRHSDPFISLRHSPQHVQILRTAHASWKRSGSKPIKPYFASVRSRNPHLPDIPCQRPLTSFTHTGPCQPSMVFRYLRTLEGVSPPLSLTHLSCQTTAKSFIASRESLSLYIPQRFRSAHRTFSGLCSTCPVTDAQCSTACSPSGCAAAGRTLLRLERVSLRSRAAHPLVPVVISSTARCTTNPRPAANGLASRHRAAVSRSRLRTTASYHGTHGLPLYLFPFAFHASAFAPLFLPSRSSVYLGLPLGYGDVYVRIRI